MKTNLQLIKEACWKANPDILKLEFGCEISFETPFSDTGIFYVVGQTEESVRCVTIEGGEYRLAHFSKDNFPKYDFEILGRPIRLADVLLMLQKADSIDRQVWLVDLWGNFERVQVMPNGAIQTTILGHYNILDDNLDNQSQETLDFIAGLLTNNE